MIHSLCHSRRDPIRSDEELRQRILDPLYRGTHDAIWFSSIEGPLRSSLPPDRDLTLTLPAARIRRVPSGRRCSSRMSRRSGILPAADSFDGRGLSIGLPPESKELCDAASSLAENPACKLADRGMALHLVHDPACRFRIPG